MNIYYPDCGENMESLVDYIEYIAAMAIVLIWVVVRKIAHAIRWVGHGGEVQELPEPPKTPRRRIPLS